jgi:hypothetical protein
MDVEKLRRVIDADVAAAGSAETRRALWKNWKVLAPALLAIAGLIWFAFNYDVDKRAVAGGVVLVGVVSNVFAWFLALLGAVPFIGPLLVKVLAIPVIWLINAIGYLVSYVAIRRGYSKDVLTYRGLTFAVIIGIIIGYILGRLG